MVNTTEIIIALVVLAIFAFLFYMKLNKKGLAESFEELKEKFKLQK